MASNLLETYVEENQSQSWFYYVSRTATVDLWKAKLAQSNLVIRNFLVTLKLFFNTKCFLSLWSKLTISHWKWFLNTNFSLSKHSLSPCWTVPPHSIFKHLGKTVLPVLPLMATLVSMVFRCPYLNSFVPQTLQLSQMTKIWRLCGHFNPSKWAIQQKKNSSLKIFNYCWILHNHVHIS